MNVPALRSRSWGGKPRYPERCGAVFPDAPWLSQAVGLDAWLHCPGLQRWLRTGFYQEAVNLGESRPSTLPQHRWGGPYSPPLVVPNIAPVNAPTSPYEAIKTAATQKNSA